MAEKFKTQDIEAPYLLVVEGNDEVEFFQCMLPALGIQVYLPQVGTDAPDAIGRVQVVDVTTQGEARQAELKIIDADGADNIKKEITRIKTALASDSDTKRPKKVAIIRDADAKGIDNRFHSIATELKRQGLPAPERPNTFSGDVNGLNVGIYIMPGYEGGRMLEDLCLDSVEIEQNTCIEDFMTCMNFPKDHVHYPKRRLLVYLATCEHKEVNNVGKAAKKGYWNFDHECFNDLKTFLSEFR